MVRKTVDFSRRCFWLMMVCVFQGSNSWGVTPEVKIATSPLFSCVGKPSTNMQFFLENVSGSLSGLAVSPTTLTSDAISVYQSSFYPSKWGGSFKKFEMTFDVNGLPQIARAASWDASDILTGVNQQAPDVSPDNRKIYTSRLQFDKSLSIIEFQWDKLYADQKSILNTSPIEGTSDGLGEKRLNYLRGARNLEQGKAGGTFRARDRVLGDITNSNSVYVGSPTSNVQGSGYQKFHEKYKDRTKAVYVGANDGMLHAFNAENGMELFSYIPNVLFPVLSQLTSPDYVHRPYVDGAIVVSEALTAGTWKTILASGLGGGAQGVFALDVTNPTDFSGGAGVLWEFTDSDDADIGNQMGAPAIAKFRIGTTLGVSEYKYFVVVPSGLNNYKEDGTGKYDAAAPGALFLLSLDKPPPEKWELNVNYFKFTVPIKEATRQNGLSAPALVVGNNGAVRYAYAGDLQGNLWRFDFNGTSSWAKVRPNNTLIFTAKDKQEKPQPITTQPKIVFAPGGGYVVLFGTGKFIEEADTAAGTFTTQSFYGIYDATQNQDGVASRNQLESRTLINDNGGALKIIGNDFTYAAGAQNKKGWYFDFFNSEQTGERSVTNSVSTYGKVFFNTLLPASNPCEKGSGRSYSLDALTGLSMSDDITGYLSQIGLLGSPILFQTGVELSGTSPTGKAKVKKKYAVYNFGTGGTKGTMAQSKIGTSDKNSLDVLARRLSWREVLNWPELHDAANKK